jgi:predicted lipoprotein with Yx(FWY)xxD motif
MKDSTMQRASRGNRKRRISSTAGLGLSLAAVAAFAAACGGGSSSASGSGSPSASDAAGSSASAPASPGSSSGAAAGVSSISSKSGDMGTYLTDDSGKTVYLFAQDTGSKSTCDGDCLTQWPAVTAKTAPKAGSGVTAGKLSVFKRSDGTMQVAYAGHPLYYFAGDSAAGDTKGQGIDGFGAKWWLVGPDGKQITKTAPPAADDSGSGYGGGY